MPFFTARYLASHGRGICVYEEVRDISTKEKPQTHIKFLSNLAKVLDKGCCPIIDSDAGFKTPWLRAVSDRGWDYVGRTRLPNFYSLDDKIWQSITHFTNRKPPVRRLILGLLPEAILRNVD